MKNQWLYIIALLVTTQTFANAAKGVDDIKIINKPDTCTPLDPVFKTNNVFAKDEPSYFWLLGLANEIHITTLEPTLRTAMIAFSPCQEKIDPYEVERYFRKLSYIRDAEVNFFDDSSGNKQLKIETWDNWTLQPNVSFGRKGSENTWSVGASEGNILGLGIAANMSYYANPDRTGYIFGFKLPVNVGYLFNTAVDFSKNDDGYTRGFSIKSPFVSKTTPWATGLTFNQEVKQTGIRLGSLDNNQSEGSILKPDQLINKLEKAVNKPQTPGIQPDGSINRFEQTVNYTDLWWGWANIGHNPDNRHRFKVGFTSDKNTFQAIEATKKLPENREYSYPWFQFSYFFDHFTKMRNIYLINSIEDINLGGSFKLKIGYDLSPTKSPFPYIWAASLKKNSRTSTNWLFSVALKAEGNALDNGTSRFLINSVMESFFTVHRLFTLYNKVHLTFSENSYIDSPVSIGDNTGLTGYPLEYSLGDHLWVFQSEIRYNPDISIFQLANLGGALFYGAGKVYGGNHISDHIYKGIAVETNNGLLQTIGFGLRFFSTRSSNGNTLYLDFARPISQDPFLDRWEWRVRGKSQF